jgi:hypothetical protein
VDICVLCTSLVLAYYIRTLFSGKLGSLYDYLWVLTVIIPVWFYLLNRNGLYFSIRRWSIFDIVSKMFNVHLLGGLLTASLIYFVDRNQYSRGLWLFSACPFCCSPWKRSASVWGSGFSAEGGLMPGIC